MHPLTFHTKINIPPYMFSFTKYYCVIMQDNANLKSSLVLVEIVFYLNSPFNNHRETHDYIIVELYKVL